MGIYTIISSLKNKSAKGGCPKGKGEKMEEKMLLPRREIFRKILENAMSVSEKAKINYFICYISSKLSMDKDDDIAQILTTIKQNIFEVVCEEYEDEEFFIYKFIGIRKKIIKSATISGVKFIKLELK